MRRCLDETTSRYLAALCTPFSATALRHHFRSAASHQFVVSSYRLSSYRRRAFSVAGPMAWWHGTYCRDICMICVISVHTVFVCAWLFLFRCHGNAVKHSRTVSCIPFIVFCSQPCVLFVSVRVPWSGSRPKYYQSSASSVVFGVCFREHDHTRL